MKRVAIVLISLLLFCQMNAEQENESSSSTLPEGQQEEPKNLNEKNEGNQAETQQDKPKETDVQKKPKTKKERGVSFARGMGGVIINAVSTVAIVKILHFMYYDIYSKNTLKKFVTNYITEQQKKNAPTEYAELLKNSERIDSRRAYSLAFCAFLIGLILSANHRYAHPKNTYNFFSEAFK